MSIRPIPHLLQALGSDLESAQLIGPGLHGLGGISYGLDRLSALLGDAELSTWLRASLDLAAQLTPDPDRVPDATPKAQPADSPPCRRSATYRPLSGSLSATPTSWSGRRAAVTSHPGPGFARGYQGLAWTLGRYATPGDKYAAAAASRS